MLNEGLLVELRGSKEYFDRSTGCLGEEHAGFRPAEGALSVAEQIAHVAQTVDWFMDAVKNGGKFDMDFENHMKDVLKTKTVADARAWLNRAFAGVIEYVENATEDELMTPFPAGPVMGGAPHLAIVGGIVDHTAHHRGALTVYARLQGVTPPMPYMDAQPA
jgi:uncharacterized damage-inducible protein DinB